MASGELQQVRCEALHWPFVFFSPASSNYLDNQARKFDLRSDIDKPEIFKYYIE